MNIKNKLLLVNLTVFLMFMATFALFYFSADDLLNLKDLEKETVKLRSLILRFEYANNAILKSPSIPLSNLKTAYNLLDRDLDSLMTDENLKYLDELTAKKIRDNYGFIKEKNFDQYYAEIFRDIFGFKDKLDKISIEMVYLNWKNGIMIDRELYDRIMAVRYRIHEFSNWYHPFSEQFRLITGDILEDVNMRVRRIILQTILMMMTTLLASILFIVFVYRNMILKIRNVRNSIELIAGGNLSTRIRITSRDELGTLGENFNTLTETIWKRLNTIGSVIHNIGQSLSQDPDSTQLEQTILHLAIENTQAENGAFYKPDGNKRILVPHHKTRGYAFPYDETTFNKEEIPYGKTIIGMSAVSGESYFVKETGGHNLLPQRTEFDRHYISSCIILPLISEREIVGIICLEKNNPSAKFRDMDYSNILSFIEFSAVTLKNLEKYSELLQATGLNRELQIASDIQKSLLPPKIPKVPGFDISVKNYSVKGISGDIYDFFRVEQGKWLFCMAEVTEKGIASSMMLVILRTLVRILVRPKQDPAELMNVLIKNFTETTGLNSAIRINLCLMEPTERRFTYCGTENQNLLVYKHSEKDMKLLESQRIAPGEYTSVKGILDDRDFIVLMTDGFYNACNAAGESYGWNPVMEILKKYSNRPSAWLQEAILKDISFFEKNTEQQDDRSLFIGGFKE